MNAFALACLQTSMKHILQINCAIFLVFLHQPAFPEDIFDVLDRADTIAVVNIYTATAAPIRDIDNGCGYAYSAFVVDGVSNVREGKLISFRSELPLQMSGTYLVFLSDSIEESETEAPLFGVSIRSPKCAESGVIMTPVQYIRGPSSTEGPEIIFELRVIRRNGAKDEQSEAEYFSVKRIMDNLFRPDVSDKGYPFGTLEIEVERATFVSQEVAYERDSFLKYIESFFAK